ncbi:MAG: hypothetical protein JSS00_06610 [Proteobacteria bacterium]|nr:hypothetical protein [Pseudomonadota bacterium]
MQDASPAGELGRACAWGTLVGLAFGALLLAFNVGGLGTLTRHSPAIEALVLVGAALAFEPAVFCCCVGGWRRGEQASAFQGND